MKVTSQCDVFDSALALFDAGVKKVTVDLGELKASIIERLKGVVSSGGVDVPECLDDIIAIDPVAELEEFAKEHKLDCEITHGVGKLTPQPKMICVQRKKYHDVRLAFDTGGLNFAFCEIKLYDTGLAKDAEATFDEAVKLGEEIAKRWNESR